MVRALRVIAVALIVLGAAAVVGPTFGFSTVATDRGLTVSTAGDPNAYLGIDAENDIGTLAGNDDPASISTLTNNLDQQVEVDVTVEEIPDGDESILTADTNALNLDPGESTTAEVECNEPESLGERDVVFRTYADGSSVSVTNATFTVTIDIQCGQGGGNVGSSDSGLSGVSVSNMSDDQTDESQAIEFDVTEDLPDAEGVTITLDQVHKIDYSSATFSSDEGTADGSTAGNDYEIVFDPGESIEAGETVTITDDGVDTTDQNAGGVYDAYFERSDKADTESLEPAFEVS